MRERGDIFEANDRGYHAGKHYIIFYSGNSDIDFIGAMVTHSQNEKNVQMSEQHFENISEDGTQYKFQFDNTNLVKAKLFKFESWGPFTKIGKLTDSGIKFVEKTIDHLPAETWEEYKERTK